MTMFRMPIFTWNMLVTGILILIAFPVLTSAVVMLFSDRHFGTHIYDVLGCHTILHPNSRLPRPADPRCSGRTSSGSSAIRRSISWPSPTSAS